MADQIHLAQAELSEERLSWSPLRRSALDFHCFFLILLLLLPLLLLLSLGKTINKQGDGYRVGSRVRERRSGHNLQTRQLACGSSRAAQTGNTGKSWHINNPPTPTIGLIKSPIARSTKGSEVSHVSN